MFINIFDHLVVNCIVLYFFNKKYITFHQNVIITIPYSQVKDVP